VDHCVSLCFSQKYKDIKFFYTFCFCIHKKKKIAMGQTYLLEVFFVMMIMDFVWLNTTKKMYQDMVVSVQKNAFTVNIWAAILCYVVLYIGIVCISIPLAKIMSKKYGNIGKVGTALLVGALFGFVVYGVFNLTNLSIFTNYNVKVAVIDTLWGCTICAITTLVGVLRS
jgi:uncharacterized membrane protein